MCTRFGQILAQRRYGLAVRHQNRDCPAADDFAFIQGNNESSKSVPAGTTKATAPFFTGSVSSTCTCALEGYSTNIHRRSRCRDTGQTPHQSRQQHQTVSHHYLTLQLKQKRGPFSHLPKHLSIFISQRGGDSVSPNSLEKAMTISRVSDPLLQLPQKRLPRPAQEAFAHRNLFCVRGNPHTGIPYAKALRREGCALAGNLEEGRGFFGTLSPSQNRFHYFSFAPQHFLYFCRCRRDRDRCGPACSRLWPEREPEQIFGFVGVGKLLRLLLVLEHRFRLGRAATTSSATSVGRCSTRTRVRARNAPSRMCTSSSWNMLKPSRLYSSLGSRWP